ncbi:fatty acid desaturase family protein [Streptomyces sp. NPDC058653]|uniref:fatty acid desaturase family protein n=1 Tax=Streptomyces sp. NPDC058653 TaxID=3346576 RepID=UPI00364C8EE9
MSQAPAEVAETTTPGPTAARTGGSDFAPLLRTVREQGLLERRTAWYARGIAVNLIEMAAIVVGMVLIGESWWALLLAPALALVSSQMSFIAHDAGHAQIFSTRGKNRAVQLFHANLLLGMSQDWWNDKHNRHHANPNHLEKDPDVGADILVFAQHQTGDRTGFRRWLTRHQAVMFFPLTTLEGIALKVYGFRSVFSRATQRQTPRERLLEGSLLVVHVVAYLALLFTTLTVGQAIAFLLIHQMIYGLHLGMAFAPNHKGMKIPTEEEFASWGHLRRQVLTSRNIRGGFVTDWFLGGLNYQVEHHLFPSMPRPHLKLAQPLVRAYCEEMEVSYVETSLVDSYRQALGHLHEVGAPLRAAA